MKRVFVAKTFIVIYLLFAVVNVQAQSGGDGDAGAEDLAAQATDPTAALMSVQFNNWYTGSYHGLPGSSNQLVLRSAIPFRLGSTQHIFRVTAPWTTSSLSGIHGVGDITIFDLMTFNADWGRWGLGVAGGIPTGKKGLSTEKWSMGPAIGFVNSSSKQYNWGLFLQSFFSIAGDSNAPDVGILNVQPIFSYQLGKGRSLSLGNSALIYNTEKSRWSNLQLGVNYGQVIKLGKHRWRPNVEVDYDFKNDTGNPEWIFRVGMVLLLPTG